MGEALPSPNPGDTLSQGDNPNGGARWRANRTSTERRFARKRAPTDCVAAFPETNTEQLSTGLFSSSRNRRGAFVHPQPRRYIIRAGQPERRSPLAGEPNQYQTPVRPQAGSCGS